MPDFTDTSSTKYCCLMYSQVQVPIVINGKNNVECAVISISYNIGKSALPDIYARYPRASAYISGNALVPVL